MTNLKSVDLPNDTLLPVYSLHSLKGGVGKTTIGLMLAATRPPALFVNLDFFGSPPFTATEDEDVSDWLMRVPLGAEAATLNPVRPAKPRTIPVEGGTPSTVQLHYLGSRSDTTPSIAAASLGRWQCEYLAERLLRQLHSVRNRWTDLGCVILDNAPGMCGISQVLLRRLTGEGSSPKPRWRAIPILIATPQSHDLRAVENAREWLPVTQNAPASGTGVRFLLNRASQELLSSLGIAGDKSLAPSVMSKSSSENAILTKPDIRTSIVALADEHLIASESSTISKPRPQPSSDKIPTSTKREKARADLHSLGFDKPSWLPQIDDIAKRARVSESAEYPEDVIYLNDVVRDCLKNLVADGEKAVD